MNFLLKLIIFSLLISHIQCYVVLGTKEFDAEVYNNEGTEETLPDTSETHIGVIVKPSEIKEPQRLQEIINFVSSDKLDNTDVLAVEDDGKETISYKELAYFLAYMQWEKEHNFYKMETEMNTKGERNFVTAK